MIRLKANRLWRCLLIPSLFRTLYLLGIGLGLCLPNAAAQDVPLPTPPVASTPTALSVPPSPLSTEKTSAAEVLPVTERKEPVFRQTPLDAVVLQDTEGNHVLTLPGPWPLTAADDFLEFILEGQQNPAPPFILRNVSATGTIIGNYVETEVRIEVLTTLYRQVRIPLGFKEGILPSNGQTEKETFRYEGTGSAFLTVDPLEEQYVAVVTPKSPASPSPNTQQTGSLEGDEPIPTEQRHTLSLLLWLPLEQNDGNRNRLVLSFPHANSSQFQIDVPMQGIETTVLRAFLLDSQENADRQTTLLRIQRLGEDSEIVWGKKKTSIVDDHPVLLIDQASIDVRLDSRSAVYDVHLPVSSATGSFDQLQVRLPQQCLLDRDTTDRYAAIGEYTVSDMDEESIVTVRLPQKTTGIVSLRFRCIQQFEEKGDQPDFSRELSGFEVLGAERQTGFLSVTIFPPEMKPHWEQVRNIRRTEGFVTAPLGGVAAPLDGASPLSSASYSAESGRFEFIAQPFLLRVQVVPSKTRINVKPDYQFHFQQGLVTMTARLTYTVSGTQADTLSLQLSDSRWHCELSPASVSFADPAGVDMDDTGLMTIPLRNPMEGTFTLEFQAYHEMPSEEEQWHRIVLPVPIPNVTWSDPAPLVIFSDNNVEVFPIDESYSATARQRIRGLTRQTRRTMPVRTNLPELQQEPLLYRTDPSGGEFVADLIYRRQQVKTLMQSDVQLLEDIHQVTQTILYEAEYVPVDRVYVLIPKALDSAGVIQVRYGNQVLTLQDIISSASEDVPENWVRKSVLLPESMFRFPLTFQYSRPPLSIDEGSAVQLSLPFIYPVEVPVSDHVVHVMFPTGYKIELHNESKTLWEPYKDPRRVPLETVETFRSAQSPQGMTLLVSATGKNISGTTMVERAWLQTWLTGEIRVDKATYLIKSTDDSVTIQLPPDMVREHRIVVRVDRQEIQPKISPTGLLTLPILPEQFNQPIEITIDYRYASLLPAFEVPVILPHFMDNISVQYQYWQVFLQPGKHIIHSPTGWTQEYHWTWNGLFWQRTPSVQKSDIGFLSSDAADAESYQELSQYVFSHFQPPSHVVLYVADRSLIVLVSSGIALLVGLILIYVPQSRYTGSFFGLAVVLAAVLFYQPPLMLLMLQAAVFGVFLALATGYVYRVFHREKDWIPIAFSTHNELFPHHSSPHYSSPHFALPPSGSQPVHEVIIDSDPALGGADNNANDPTLIKNTSVWEEKS